MDGSAGRMPILGRIADWLRNWAKGRESQWEIERSSDAARMAHDLGMSTGELVNLAKHGPHSADLLARRLEAEHLDPGLISRTQPEVMRDMSRLCSQCRTHGRCARDLAHDPDDPKWRDYCPNVGTIDALRQN